MERRGTGRNTAGLGSSAGADSAFFLPSAAGVRHPGNSLSSTTPLGGVDGERERHSPEPTSTDRRAGGAEWVRENLPSVAAVATAFREEFGDVRLVHAVENGHEIGRPGTDGVKLSETHVGPMAIAGQDRMAR